MAIPVGVYLLMLVGSVLASPDPRASTRGLSEIFILTTLLTAPFLVRGERQVRLALDTLIGLAALLACEGLSQFLFGYGDIDRRIRGPFSHYMTFSGFLLICDLLLLASMLYTRAVAEPLAVGGAGGDQRRAARQLTRNAWVALALSLTVMIAFRAPRLLLAYLPAAVLLVALAPVPILHRMLSIVDLRDSSNYDRLCMLEAGITMVRQRPVFGVGPDLVKRFYPIYRAPAAPRYEVPHLHNTLLQLAAERGLPSLAAYLAMTVVAAAAAWRRVRPRGRTPGAPGRPLHGSAARPPRLQSGGPVREQLGGRRGAAADALRAGAPVLPARRGERGATPGGSVIYRDRGHTCCETCGSISSWWNEGCFPAGSRRAAPSWRARSRWRDGGWTTGNAVSGEARVAVLAPKEPFVSRAGRKLALALDHFGLDPAGWTCLDVGASTGGFTDCLLQRGAARVYALDVGYGQLDHRLASTPGWWWCERINARNLARRRPARAVRSDHHGPLLHSLLGASPPCPRRPRILLR